MKMLLYRTAKILLAVVSLFTFSFLGAEWLRKREAIEQLQIANKKLDPNLIVAPENSNQKFKSEIEGAIQFGTFSLEDNSQIKFWFLSHHGSPDRTSHTIFELGGGKKIELTGYFCCEVMFDQPIKSESDLLAFISKHNDNDPDGAPSTPIWQKVFSYISQKESLDESPEEL